MAHLRNCRACRQADAHGWLCTEGEALHAAWGHADALAARLTETDAFLDNDVQLGTLPEADQ